MPLNEDGRDRGPPAGFAWQAPEDARGDIVMRLLIDVEAPTECRFSAEAAGRHGIGDGDDLFQRAEHVAPDQVAAEPDEDAHVYDDDGEHGGRDVPGGELPAEKSEHQTRSR